MPFCPGETSILLACQGAYGEPKNLGSLQPYDAHISVAIRDLECSMMSLNIDPTFAGLSENAAWKAASR